MGRVGDKEGIGVQYGGGVAERQTSGMVVSGMDAEDWRFREKEKARRSAEGAEEKVEHGVLVPSSPADAVV